MIYRIPRAFYDDHVSRELPAGSVVKVLAKKYDVALDAAEYDELLSDARFYVGEGVGVFGAEYVGLIASARATVKALVAAGSPAEQAARMAAEALYVEVHASDGLLVDQDDAIFCGCGQSWEVTYSDGFDAETLAQVRQHVAGHEAGHFD